MLNVLLVDNFDSYTFNLHHLLGALDDVHVEVRRNNEPFVDDLKARKFGAMVISPGPGSPDDVNYFGYCRQAIVEAGPMGLPILGVCLGFQGLALAYGGKLKRAAYPMHGKTSTLRLIAPSRLLQGIPDSMPVMRYHSIMVDPDTPLAPDMLITAEVDSADASVATNGREIMAMEHRTLPIFGVQFHPESFATGIGVDIARRFVTMAREADFVRQAEQAASMGDEARL